MSMINLLKKLPVDFGQGELRAITKGKKIAMSYVENTKNKSALDIGCREGIQSEWLKRKGYITTSIDIVKKYNNCLIVDVNKGLPFKDNEFDLIWCSEVIEHLIDPKVSINEFNRVLKSDGKIIITTPNSYFWFYYIARIFGKKPRDLQNSDHKHFFSIKAIKELFPKGKILGYFPYMVYKFIITKNIELLSPTFVVIDN